MPFYASKLTDVLSEHLPDWHGARLKFISRYIGSLLKLTMTNGKKLALALKATVKTESNYRRIQRFMADYSFDFEVFGHFLLSLLPQKSGFVVVMDRTEWHFGRTPVNVLMIGFAYKGIAFPVLWQVLRKEGSSSTENEKLFSSASCGSTSRSRSARSWRTWNSSAQAGSAFWSTGAFRLSFVSARSGAWRSARLTARLCQRACSFAGGPAATSAGSKASASSGGSR